jgi:hypothetical protein
MLSFFDFGESNTRSLFHFLQDSLAKNYEFEIRFGKFLYEKNNEKNNEKKQYRFDSNMEIESFYNLKNMFDSQMVEKGYKNTREFIYAGDKCSIKRIVDLDDHSVISMIKSSVRRYDIYDYDIRISVAYEKMDVPIEHPDEFYMIRTKNRTSYKLSFGTLDFTIIEQKDCKKNTVEMKYEVEMEITMMDKENIMTHLMVLLQARQNNFFVIPGNEKRRVIYEYRNMLKVGYFVGAQPETLHKDKISTIYKSDYSITDKADGDRVFLFIDKNGNVYILDSNLNNVFRTDIKQKNKDYYSSIIDAELVRSENKICILAFDLLYYGNKDIRGDKNYLLKKRLEKLDEIIRNLSTSDYYETELKKYYFGNVFSASKKILDSVSDKSYENDGLIFTPVNEPYSISKKWPSLLKWKPVELNTIDFYVERVESTNRWNLYIQAPKENSTQRNTSHTEKVLFDVEKLCGDLSVGNVVTYETTFSDSLIDKTTNSPYQSKTVIEFKWDKELSKFIPLRTRWDKTANPSKHGNFVKVACDIWNNIHNPIEKDYLLKFYSNNKIEKDIHFERMRRFHNKVKEYLYNKYCKNNNYLLELCSGKGGDLHKWLYNNVRHIDGYDVSCKHIDECKRRFESLKLKDAPCFNFYNLDLKKADAPDVVYRSKQSKYDTICCQFAIHYFFESKNSLENVFNILENCLNDNGHFIITFMDDQSLDNLFCDKNNVCYEENGEIIYMLERDTKRDSLYGNRLKITLNGNNILGDGSDEWIVNFKSFCDVMTQRGFECVETELFSKLYNKDLLDIDLLNYEKHISFLNRYAIFRKTTSVQLDIDLVSNQVVYNNIPTEYNFETVDLHQKNITVQKITSTYNIIDILNCIEYKYYKNNVKNKVLDDVPENVFSEIVNIFDKLKIEYVPIFVQDPLDFNLYNNTTNNVYFTYYKHIIEKKTDEEEEKIEYHNWYIIMYNDKLIFTNPNPQQPIPHQTETQQPIPHQTETHQTETQQPIPHQTETQQPNAVEIKVHQIKTVENSDSDENMKKNILKKYNNMKNDKKVTIKMFKELLQEANLKVSGKKEELEMRLIEYLAV